MREKRVLLILGGTWHDFEGFTAAMTPVFGAAGYAVEPTYDLDALTGLEAAGYDLVTLYTCLGQAREGEHTAPGLTEAQAQALAAWVRADGALLAVHAATVASQSSPALRALLGGAFVEHPPQFSFTAYPMRHTHPITEGVPAFAVRDEFYVQDYDPGLAVHMVALDRGVAHPMVWTRTAGRGRVAYVAMGHDEGVWALPPYRRLMVQAADWLTGSDGEGN
jgi:hypothetical protein